MRGVPVDETDQRYWEDRTDRLLRDILGFAEAAARIVARGRDAYDSDETLQLATEAILHKLGEAISRLPEEFIAAHPGVAWRAMKATRNLVAHQYDQVDYGILWNGIARRLPGEMEQIRTILDARRSR